jgi:16S rRNA (uracil1498-N3)-methyltransferase
MRRFFISDNSIDEENAIITGKDFHHIKHVLRLKKGHTIQLITQKGQKYQAHIEKITNRQICTKITQSDQTMIQPKIHITIAQSMLKEKKMDHLVRQTTELGVSRWIAYISERSTSRPDSARMKQKVQRWQKIAKSAAQQCNGHIPEIHDQFVDINDIVSLSSEKQQGYFFWEKSDHLISSPQKPYPESIILVFGPEGGFSENEVDRARNAGFMISSLGPRILRAETATVSGLALMQYFFDST